MYKTKIFVCCSNQDEIEQAKNTINNIVVFKNDPNNKVEYVIYDVSPYKENKYFSEMTMIFHLNEEDYGDADFVGVCHYGRLFDNIDLTNMYNDKNALCIPSRCKYPGGNIETILLAFDSEFPKGFINVFNEFCEKNQEYSYLHYEYRKYDFHAGHTIILLHKENFIKYQIFFNKFCKYFFELYDLDYLNDKHLDYFTRYNVIEYKRKQNLQVFLLEGEEDKHVDITTTLKERTHACRWLSVFFEYFISYYMVNTYKHLVITDTIWNRA